MNHDKAFGAYIGAAIGDAMGGPVECSHAARIQRTVGEITGFLPYNGDYSLLTAPRPGYALRVDAGAVTDDTFIRGDLTRYFIATEPPRDATSFANWLLEHADFSMWWIPAVDALQRVRSGEVTAETGGLSHQQGGGVGWWTPIGIMHAGDPVGAFAEAKKLCTIWKDPLEQDLLAAVQAGVATGMVEGATVSDILETMLGLCGTLARKFLERGIDIGRASGSQNELIERLYASVLVNEQPPYSDLDLPPVQTPLEDTDDRYASILLCEQVALAAAAFAYGAGDPKVSIPLTIMIGRDCDSSATAVGSWCGALHGEAGLPAGWVNTVCEVNMPEIDIRDLAAQLVTKTEAE
jgi:ADP-ribosylglycohydrolase